MSPLLRATMRTGAALLVVACTTREATEIFVVVDSDLNESRRTVFDAIRLRVLRLDDRRASPPPYPDALEPPPLDLERDAAVRVEQYSYAHVFTHEFPYQDGVLPIEVGVAPHGGDADRIAYFEAFAMIGDHALLRTAARTSFVRGRSVRLYLWLTADCVGVACPIDQVCEAHRCVPVDRPMECLTPTSTDAASVHRPMCYDGGAAPNADRDRDGVPTDLDCDDDDPSVWTTAARPCTCGPELQHCIAGVWLACESPSCRCEPGSAPRTVVCGNCGQIAESCVAGQWTDDTACTMEGECAAGGSEQETMPCTCGAPQTRNRYCGMDCAWGAWGAWSGCTAGACVPGTRQSRNCGQCNGGSQSRTCQANCTWGGYSTCTGGGCQCTAGDTRTFFDAACGMNKTEQCNSDCCGWTCVGTACC